MKRTHSQKLQSLALAALAVGLVSVTSASENRLPRLKVSENNRFLVTEDGQPFFYLADTAWGLFHRLNREEADRYLADRAAKGFNVVQAVVLAEQNGLTDPNAYGHLPLIDKTDPTRPATKPGPKNDYWDYVDEIIDMAADKGLYIGLLPTWGRYVTSHWANGIVDGIFNVENAQQYGQYIGHRYRDRMNIIWIIGGGSVFAGACGHTYGHNSIWQMFAPGGKPILSPKCYWYEALDAPSARQMGYLRKLLESRPFLSRVPDQSLIASDPEDSISHLQATRGDGYAFVYSPMGGSFRIHLGRITGDQVRASWFDPRTGSTTPIDTFPNRGDREFDPPGEPAVGNDWVLVLDDAAKAFPLPEVAATKDLHAPWFDFGYSAIDGHIFVEDDGKPYLDFTRNGSQDGYSFGIMYGVALADGTEMFIVYHTHADAQKPSGDCVVNIDRIGFGDSAKLEIVGPTRSPQPMPSGCQ